MKKLIFWRSFTWRMVKIGVIAWTIWQVVLMSAYAWAAHCDGHKLTNTDYLNRWSWSDAQALGFVAAAVAFYAFWCNERSLYEKLGITIGQDEKGGTDLFDNMVKSKKPPESITMREFKKIPKPPVNPHNCGKAD